ncbi:MAG: hypothetical protein Q3971_04695 [Moraxella sp.]|nr:hypothetical protein [Moraxella sp.]
MHITLQNGNPCFYIKDKNFKGKYQFNLHTHHQGITKDWYYENTFEEHYPNQEHCIEFNQDNFPDWEAIVPIQRYSISLWSMHPKKRSYGTHGNDFCVIQENHEAKITLSTEYCRHL